MLKAVRFDESQHKQLLDFIKNYRDNKGRINESEAIRSLMQKGLESLQTQVPTQISNINDKELNINTIKQEVLNEITQLIPKNNTQPDIEQIKKELYNEVLSEINNQTLNNLNNILDKISNLQPIVVQQGNINQETPVVSKINNEKSLVPVNKIEIPGDADGLLGNLLANANR